MFYLTIADILNEENRRIVAGWTIMFTCIGVFVLTYAASDLSLPRWVYFFEPLSSCSHTDGSVLQAYILSRMSLCLA